jgi:hypothetical protein
MFLSDEEKGWHDGSARPLRQVGCKNTVNDSMNSPFRSSYSHFFVFASSLALRLYCNVSIGFGRRSRYSPKEEERISVRAFSQGIGSGFPLSLRD